MRSWRTGVLALAVGIAACGDDDVFVPVDGAPAAPRALEARYYNRAVFVTWELAPAWDQESFRVYSRRASDPEYFLVAEVTSCAGGLCNYTDANVTAGVTYQYYVAAVGPRTGVETASDHAVEVFVPQPQPPPVPGGLEVVALDGALYLRWNLASRSADDFSFYRVYLHGSGNGSFLLGETDSEGFLDLLAQNGETSTYFVTAVDDQGHESDGSGSAAGTPRPDYHGELIYAIQDRPELSGFRFQESEDVDPLVSGTSPNRHFRLELDAAGWWLVPGPQAQVHGQVFATTALKCGVASDATCVDVPLAPAGNYSGQAIELLPQTSYVLRVAGDDGQLRYGVVRVVLLGFDQAGDALMIFDWAYQIQAGNRSLAPAAP